MCWFRCETTGDACFHWRKCYYVQKWWFELKTIVMMDLFLTNMQLLSSQDINCWTVAWIIVMFGLSRHPFTGDVMLHFYKSDEETNSSTSWMAWGYKSIFLGELLTLMCCWGSFRPLRGAVWVLIWPQLSLCFSKWNDFWWQILF